MESLLADLEPGLVNVDEFLPTRPARGRWTRSRTLPHESAFCGVGMTAPSVKKLRVKLGVLPNHHARATQAFPPRLRLFAGWHDRECAVGRWPPGGGRRQSSSRCGTVAARGDGTSSRSAPEA